MDPISAILTAVGAIVPLALKVITASTETRAQAKADLDAEIDKHWANLDALKAGAKANDAAADAELNNPPTTP
jgi:hypothetical protein